MFASNTSAADGESKYIEDLFSTYLYTGNGSTQTITNGIDLAGKGGMVWLKGRSGSARPHCLFDTVRGDDSQLSTNSTAAASTGWSSYFDFSSTGFGFPLTDGDHNANNETFASWTFRKQRKFFDVVTWTGDGTTNRQIAHNLGSAPGCIIIKATSSASANNWLVWHKGWSNLLGTAAGSTYCLGYLNDSLALNQVSEDSTFGSVPTDSYFNLNYGGTFGYNASGQTFVAYLFAHDAGGFGLTSTDNVISCGSFTTDVSGQIADVNLGYEPQWLMLKNASAVENWLMFDNMRGIPTGTADARLIPNLTNAEALTANNIELTSTGFKTGGASLAGSATYIYIAIRRGPMKVPTSGTSVYKGVTRTGTGTTPWVASGAGFPPDMTIMSGRTSSGITSSSYQHSVIDRVRRATEHIQTVNASGEGGSWGSGHIHNMDGYDGLYSSDGAYWSDSPELFVDNHFRRAPGFFDVVCYTGTGSARTVAHNLGVTPELMIVKNRNITRNWAVYDASNGATRVTILNSTAGFATSSNPWNNTAPTSSVFTVGIANETNFSGNTFVAYLFATCAGVSKVGSYTGTGTTKQVDCGFTGGARFIIIKRTDSTGDWYMWDSARGIVSGNDPYLLLNSGVVEVTNTDYVDTYSAGFEISSTAPAAINASGGTFIFLAIA